MVILVGMISAGCVSDLNTLDKIRMKWRCLVNSCSWHMCFFLGFSGAQEKDSKVLFRKAVVKFGDFFVLNCTTDSSSNSSCDIQERSSRRYDYREAGPTWKAFTFIAVYWSFNATCVVTCNNEPRSWETIVTVYRKSNSAMKVYHFECCLLWRGLTEVRWKRRRNSLFFGIRC